MSDRLASLPPFPDDSRDRLPPPPRNWGRLLWPAAALAAGGGLFLAARFGGAAALPAYLIAPEAAGVAMLAFLGLCGILVVAVTLGRRGP
jgi:hypothetical protein